MLIIDALRHAETAQEVCFLLTSYVETLPFYDTAHQLPAVVTQLPVRGLEDIAARLAGLQAARRLDPAGTTENDHSAVLDEAIRLFGEALARVHALDAAGAAQFSYDRRTSERPAGALRV